MKRIRTVVWPYVAAGLCLLGLSIAAPLAWRGEVPSALYDHPTPTPEHLSAGKIARWADKTGPLSPWWKTAAGREGAVAHIPGGLPVDSYPTEIPPPLPDFVAAEAGTILLGDELILSELPEDHHLELVSLAAPRTAHPEQPRHIGPSPSGSWLAQVHPPVSQQYGGPPAGPRPTTSGGPSTLPSQLDWPRLDTAAAAMWPVPGTLIQELEGVDGNPLGPEWARQVAVALVALQKSPSRGAAESAEALDQLRTLSQRIERLTMRPDTTGELLGHFTAIRRAAYAIARRVDVWRHVQKAEAARLEPGPTPKPLGLAGASGEKLGGAAGAQGPAPIDEHRALRDLLADVEPLLGEGATEKGWKTHLRWEELSLLAAGETTSDDALRGHVGRRVLVRMEQSKLGPAQKAFLQRAPFLALEQQLKTWIAAEPVDYPAILADLERYEEDPNIAQAKIVADDCDRLRFHTPQDAEVGKVIEAHYRNANLRVAVSGELINRLIPTVDPVREEVNDHILGARVRGDSVTWTKLFVRLLPDHRRLRFGLEARGNVYSDTESSKGPARIRSEGSSDYVVRKTVTGDRHGVRASRSEASARAYNETVGVNTDWDGFPIVSQIVRNAARTQAEEMGPEAARETEWRIEERARQRMDSMVQQKLTEAERNFHKTITAPLVKLGLEPTPVEMQTTEQRITTRVRLAAHEQLGAHTPRLQAPADSLISIQLHESAVNNTFARLALEGKEYKLEELLQKVFTAAGQKPPKITEDMPEGVTIRFADEEAVRFRFEAGEAVLTIRIAKLVQDGKVWKDFQVRGRFRPVPRSGLSAAMARDGIIELSGKKLSFSSQISLRTIFTKVFSNQNQLHLVPDQIIKDPRLKGLEVNQFELEGGWLAVAIGPAGGMRIVRHPSRGTILR